MTNERNDGGPAFPRDHTHYGHNGMTLRDYFASKAPPPPNWWGKYRKDFQVLSQEAEHIAMWNYEYADAMLRQRNSQ